MTTTLCDPDHMASKVLCWRSFLRETLLEFRPEERTQIVESWLALIGEDLCEHDLTALRHCLAELEVDELMPSRARRRHLHSERDLLAAVSAEVAAMNAQMREGMLTFDDFTTTNPTAPAEYGLTLAAAAEQSSISLRRFADQPETKPVKYLNVGGTLREPLRNRRWITWREVASGAIFAVVTSGFVVAILRLAGCPW